MLEAFDAEERWGILQAPNKLVMQSTAVAFISQLALQEDSESLWVRKENFRNVRTKKKSAAFSDSA
jgi:hypothetical protein